MKIAFVAQPIDTILPPYQNSVGACTYGAARALAESNDVTVYGLRDRHNGELEIYHRRVRFRFVKSSLIDRLAFRVRNKLAKAIQISSPISISRWLFPGYGRRVARELAKEEFDVIHVQHCSQYVPIIRKLNPGAKIDLQLHAEWFSQCEPQALAERLHGLDLLSAVSDHITHKTRRDVPRLASRCETIYNGINVDEFSDEKTYTPEKNKRLMYAGGISPHKGIHVLLDAFRLVTERFPDVRLDIIGPHGTYPLEETFDLQDRATLKQVEPFYQKSVLTLLRRKLGRRTDSGRENYSAYLKSKLPPDIAGKVSFRGMITRSELVDAYYRADVFVFPPIWDEGFGIPPVEAMAAGTPVVASRSGAIVETVLHGKTGLLVPKNDAGALADAMIALLQDDAMRERMGRAGRARVRENFTWDKVAQKMEREYQALCSEHPAPRNPVQQVSAGVLTTLRSLWVIGLLGSAVVPWTVKSRFGINGRFHDLWHLLTFLATAVLLSTVSTDPEPSVPGGAVSSWSSRAMVPMLGLILAFLTEGLEVWRYHIGFEWSDMFVDCFGLLLGFALGRQISSLPAVRVRGGRLT